MKKSKVLISRNEIRDDLLKGYEEPIVLDSAAMDVVVDLLLGIEAGADGTTGTVASAS